jgi:radical SAM protein with 4Fe4S-binding SPASM domain
MKLKKYYDFLKSNNSFLKTKSNQKLKILLNITKYLKSKKKLIVRNKPIIAQIEPTSHCNLKCEMCIREKIDVPIGTMTFKDFEKILEELDSLSKIHLSGQGEPLLNKELFDMIKYANNRGITIFFTTNGTMLTKEIINKICKVDIGEIGISIDSTIRKKYERIRKGANFNKVKINIKNLVLELKKNKKKTIVSTSAVILKDNLNEMPEFINLANSLGIKKVGFQTVQEKKDYLDKYNPRTKTQVVSNFNGKLKEKIKEAKKIAKKYNITIIFDEEESVGCIWPWRSIYITWNGNITPCCKILDYKKPYFGNILKKDFWEIWNGKEYQLTRKLLRKRKAPLECKGCNMV